MDDHNDDRLSVYEVGYLIASSIPAEQVPAQGEAIKKAITGAGASVIAEGEPHEQELAYAIRKKTVSGAYDSYSKAYFGWIKFEVGSDKIEAVKKTIEEMPSVLRMLLMSTVKENTFLGKRAPVAAAKAAPAAEEKKAAASASVEEIDKSIEEMVKEAR